MNHLTPAEYEIWALHLTDHHPAVISTVVGMRPDAVVRIIARCEAKLAAVESEAA